MQCPVAHGESNCPVNANTNMPGAIHLQQETDTAAAVLSPERSESTIPRTDGDWWVYPSPRMFYNALRRKGFTTAAEDIVPMLDIHNFLNEAVWQEVLRWESRHAGQCGEPRLKRFMGRPQELSPKAWWSHWVRGAPRPFDRHDWTVDRCGREVRYIIDYYAGPKDEATGQPTFYCDVRPALDSLQSVWDRLRHLF